MRDPCDFCGIKCIVNVNCGHVSDYRNCAVSCRVSLHAGADLPGKTWQQHFQIVVVLGRTVLAGPGPTPDHSFIFPALSSQGG